jgi:hypothetical protein
MPYYEHHKTRTFVRGSRATVKIDFPFFLTYFLDLCPPCQGRLSGTRASFLSCELCGPTLPSLRAFHFSKRDCIRVFSRIGLCLCRPGTQKSSVKLLTCVGALYVLLSIYTKLANTEIEKGLAWRYHIRCWPRIWQNRLYGNSAQDHSGGTSGAS